MMSSLLVFSLLMPSLLVPSLLMPSLLVPSLLVPSLLVSHLVDILQPYSLYNHKSNSRDNAFVPLCPFNWIPIKHHILPSSHFTSSVSTPYQSVYRV